MSEAHRAIGLSPKQSRETRAGRRIKAFARLEARLRPRTCTRAASGSRRVFLFDEAPVWPEWCSSSLRCSRRYPRISVTGLSDPPGRGEVRWLVLASRAEHARVVAASAHARCSASLLLNGLLEGHRASFVDERVKRAVVELCSEGVADGLLTGRAAPFHRGAGVPEELERGA